MQRIATLGILTDEEQPFLWAIGLTRLWGNSLGALAVSLAPALLASFRETLAFVLQAFAQSCIMVGLVSDSFPRMKGGLAGLGGGHGKTSASRHRRRPLRSVAQLLAQAC